MAIGLRVQVPRTWHRAAARNEYEAGWGREARMGSAIRGDSARWLVVAVVVVVSFAGALVVGSGRGALLSAHLPGGQPASRVLAAGNFRFPYPAGWARMAKADLP